jgi:MinD-like ATPase involved in chromosome partitioning or flagellar assembly
VSGATAVATVLCAVRGEREADVVTTLDAPGLQVTRRCADVTELRAAAAAGAGRVAVVSSDLPALDREAVAELRAHGVRVVALALPGSWEEGRLRALGVDAVVDLAASPDELRDVVRSAAPADAGAGHPAGRAPVGAETVGPAPARRDGRVVAVWGPTGAPGRTVLAVNLAAELAGPAATGRRGRGSRRDRRAAEVELPSSAPTGPAADVLLVDADTYGGTVAQHLGMLDESPGLAAAVRSAGQGALDAAGLVALAPAVMDRVRVLTGVARAARWPELPGASLDAVWEVARAVADWTVVDCGFAIERDELLTYDTRAPQRNDATLSALAAADAVVVVGAADPVGLQRLVRALDELAEAGVVTGALRVVVVNRVRSAVVGPRPERAVRDAMARYAGVDDLHAVPEDRSLDVALREGRALAEVAPASPARRAIAGLAAHVRATTPVPAGRGASHGHVREASH